VVQRRRHDHHLRPLAIVHGRQSYPQHVAEYVESTARHYALVDLAVTWRWSRERVVIIAADQGQSGQSLVTRLGFQGLLAEVRVDHVGPILGLEMNRLARSKTD
jgi:hypothetical protein